MDRASLSDSVDKIVLKYHNCFGILKEYVIEIPHELDENFSLRENEEEMLSELLK